MWRFCFLMLAMNWAVSEEQTGPLGTPLIEVTMASGKIQYTYRHKSYAKFADIHDLYSKEVQNNGRTNGYSFLMPHAASESLTLYAYMEVPDKYYVTGLFVDGVELEKQVREKLYRRIQEEYDKAIKKYDGPEYQVRRPGAEGALAVTNASRDAAAAVKAQLAAELKLKQP